MTLFAFYGLKQNASYKQIVVLLDVGIPNGMAVLNPTAGALRGQVNIINGVVFERPDR